MLTQVQGRTLQERESSASKQVSHSKILIQSKMNPSNSFFFVVVFNLCEFREFFFLSGTLDAWFPGGVGKGGASGRYMSTFSAAKAESLLGALLSFLGGEFLGEFDCVNVHGVGVFSGSRGRRGKRLESLSRPSTSLSDLLSTIPLVLEVSRLSVPFIDFVGNSVKGHDLLHERGGDSCGEETDQDIMVRDAGTGGVALECRDVTLERRGVLPILSVHMMGGQPGDGIPSCVLVFEHCLEFLEKVVPGSKGDGGAIDGIFLEGISPGQG